MPISVHVIDGTTFEPFPGDQGSLTPYPFWLQSGAFVAGGNDPPTINIEKSTYTVNQKDGTVTINVQLSQKCKTDTITVNYATSNGTALAGSDYTSTWAP